MGDRAMAEIRTSEGSLYFYTHWGGQQLVQAADNALESAKGRLSMGDDEVYGLKIIIDNLIKDVGGRDSETGGAFAFSARFEDEYNADTVSVLIDLKRRVVVDHAPGAERPRGTHDAAANETPPGNADLPFPN